MTQSLAHRIAMLFGRGVVHGVDDTSARQTLQVEMLKDEVLDNVERMQNYGFTSHPTGGDVAVGFISGAREQGIILVVDDRRYRITTLQPGEVVMYDDLGNRVELLREMVKITAVQHLEAVAPTAHFVADVVIDGSLTVNGSLINNGKLVDSTHSHSGVQPGAGNTGAPV